MKNSQGELIKKKIQKRELVIETILQDKCFIADVWNLSQKIIECFENGNKLFFCGNGGSAADCQHIVAEFIVKLSDLRKSLPAIALTSNNSIITAISNDIDYNYVFVRQLEGMIYPGDILIGISTSGRSQNVINAFEYANKHGLYTISVTGSNNNVLRDLANEKIVIPSEDTQIVQEMYLMVFHIVCENIDEYYLNHNKNCF